MGIVLFLIIMLVTFIGVAQVAKKPSCRPTRPRARVRRPARDAAARARRLTAICTGAATAWMAGGTVAAAAGQPLVAVILYVTAFILAAGATWPALRRRYAWLVENPSLAWCLLAGKQHRRQLRQLRIALAAQQVARVPPDHPAVPSLRPAQCWTSPAGATSLMGSRWELGLTAFQLGTAAKLPPGALQEIEAGQRRVTVRTARALETALQTAAGMYRRPGWHPEADPGKHLRSQYTAHYHASSGGWLHYYSESGTDLWFGPPDPACRCDACQEP
jgi:hypothetical protein